MKISFAVFLLTVAVNAAAAPKIGNADLTDFTLGGHAADGIAFSTANGQAGPNGNVSTFNNTLTGSWTLLAKVDSSGTFQNQLTSLVGSPLGLSFSLSANKKSGEWSVVSSKSMILDLVLGMHAGGATTSFLFDNTQLTAGQTQTGTFKIDWFNGSGKNVPAYSNLTMFYKDASLISVSPVPEPATYGMMLAGLGLLGFMMARRKNRGGMTPV